ncbi:hypothetical protein FPZ12_008005 [Amycolatopsis acidicola]|uniref:Uncharacterized protein n=1 Tax=Amycolatopsis acidicola TaxID=2596893 RepID=A0A5N0VD32_9PSEU|nr:hypothetical protein [Amycolatopsis acidicola]KAA9163965.1 hypothetical protein FPZ12_008005 [Amycolatopsis acidicola]
MVPLPVQAALPTRLAPQEPGPAITVPGSSTVVGSWIPTGFPDTPEGALGQLKALNETAVEGGDPSTYDRAYARLAEPGAPSSEDSGLHTLLTNFRRSAGLSAGSAEAGLRVDYDVTHGLIKGSVEDNHFAVVCTLGQLTFEFQTRSTTLGVGDCQAMRWTGSGWKISHGVRAAYAPAAWPGSLDSVKAGYRALTVDGGR